MKKIIKDYFSFSKIERRGIFVLLVIIFLLLAGGMILPRIFTSKSYDFSAFQKEIEEFEKSHTVLNEEKSNDHPWKEFDYSQPDRSMAISRLQPFHFDPNELTQQEWKKLGLTDKQAQTIMNYRAKGGIFRCKKDFKKMYCISEEEYKLLAPYIKLPDSLEKKTDQHFDTRSSCKDEFFTIEINTASEEDFVRIKGIGEYFAKQIVDYRRSLGGFCRKEQLLEVHKMDSSRYEQMLPYITLNPSAVRHIDVNSASFDELRQHPYIGYNIALSLVSYRTKHGKFKQIKDIKSSALITEQVYAKISPYLRAE